MRPDAAPVVDQMYAMSRWLIAHTAKFPRSHKFVLGDRIVCRALDVLETLTRAAYSREKDVLLDRANADLQGLRILVRLSFEERLTSTSQYAYASVQLTEIGAQIGGWIKQSGTSPNEKRQRPDR